MSTNGAYLNTEADYDTDSWSTPQEEFNKLDDEFHFTLDVCASDTNHKCAKYFTEEMDGLAQDWGTEICFCNPPYSDIPRWIAKCYDAYTRGATCVMLLKADTSTVWFRHWYRVMVAIFPNILHHVRFLPRIKFVPPPGYVGSINEKTGKPRKADSPNFGSVLFVFQRPPLPAVITQFRRKKKSA